MDVKDLTIRSVHEGLKEKKFSAKELAQVYLDRIKAGNDELNACVLVTEDVAMEQAGLVDADIAAGKDINVLAGVTLGVKDLFCTKDVETTACSNMLKGFIPPYDATSVKLLKEKGMVMLAKANTDEFACGASTEHSCFGPTKNAWNHDYVAGGSSGGPAAGVGAGMFLAALGTDTGGSIRQPAAFNNCVGLKPTYGRVSRSGVIALASSWDTVGSFTRTVEDAAFMLQGMAGDDPLDATTPPVEVPDYSKFIGKDLKGMKIGVPKEYFGEGVTADTKEIVMAAIKEYEKMGIEVKEVSLPHTEYAVATYYVIMPAELSANLARFDGVRFGSKPKETGESFNDYYLNVRNEGFGDEIKRRIMIGTYVLSAGYYDAYYKRAQKVRTLIRQDFDNVFKEVDIIMAPVSPFPPFKLGAKADDPLAMYLADALLIPSSAAGMCAMSIPAGFNSEKLPIGLQLIAPQFEEGRLFQFGAAYEQVTDWGMRMV